MARPPISHTELSPTLALSECHDGFWIYDETRGMNLAMRAKTRDAAFVEVIMYYQKRLKEIESSYACLTGRVEAFVSQFPAGIVEDDG
jgi:hypothetical protein